MHSKWVFKHFLSLSKRHLQLLFLVWVAGLFLGMLLCATCNDQTAQLCTGVARAVANRFALVLVCLLPIVIVVIALFARLFFLAYPVVFLMAFSRGFSGFLVCMEQGSGAWLIRPMFLFSAGCTSVILWWLLIRNCNGRRLNFRKDIAIAIASLFVVNTIDLCFISPFLAGLSKYF